ncbi:MAG: response regulator receiver [Thermoleophilia bacterium]|nr:response regulator receiver [Thermoleophilia bacterium]
MRPIEILLVEDNPGDVRLTREGLAAAKLVNNLSVVNDGVSALQRIRREGEYAGASRPDLVLLDLNLPGFSGLDVLRELKGDPALRSLPVVVLSSSEAENDIARSYDLHANCYVTKPIDFEQFVDVVAAIEQFWFSIVKLPVHD